MKTQRIPLLAIMALLPLAMLPAQDSFGPQDSLAAQKSFGLFPNIIDAAFSPVFRPGFPSFGNLESDYLLTGILNLDLLEATDSSLALPFRVGYYHSGDRPWMLGLTSFVRSLSDETVVDGIVVLSQETTTGGGTSGNDETTWVSSDRLLAHDFSSFWAGSSTLGYLVGLETGTILGVQLGLDLSRGDPTDVGAWLEANRTETLRYYYDTTAGTPPPVPALDYTVTTTRSDPHNDLSLRLALPLAFRTGSLGSTVTLSGEWATRDRSSAISVLTRLPADATGAPILYDDVNARTTDQITRLGVSLDYRASLPPLVWTSEANETLLNLRFAWAGFLPKDVEENRSSVAGSIRSTPGDLTKTMNASTDTVRKDERNIPAGLAGSLGFGQSFYFSLAPDTWFSFYPAINLNFLSGPNPGIPGLSEAAGALWTSRSTSTVVAKTYDATGTVSSYLKTVTITETLDDGSGTANTYGLEFSFPTALKARPAGWPFGFTLSSNARIRYSLVHGTDLTPRVQTSVETFDQNDDSLGKTVTRASSEEGSINWLRGSWEVLNENALCLNVPLPGEISLDLILNWNNLLELDSLVAQVVVPLP